jgi:hypothetical protein
MPFVLILDPRYRLCGRGITKESFKYAQALNIRRFRRRLRLHNLVVAPIRLIARLISRYCTLSARTATTILLQPDANMSLPCRS